MLPKSVSRQQLAKFRAIRDQFAATPVPEIGQWRSMSDDDIWLRVVSQVVVVGKEAPAHKLRQKAIRTRLSFRTLAAMAPRDAARSIGVVLASIGTRWVSGSHPEAAPKVKALMKNLDVLRSYPRGPYGLVEHLAAMPGSKERVAYLSEHFAYLKAKGARDFLTTGLGMAADVIALDSRVMGIAASIVPKLPAKVTSKDYDAIEEFLVRHVCVPLGLSAVQFDQILFHNQADIAAYLRDGTFREGMLNLSALTLAELQSWQSQVAAEIQRRQVS